jgi:hypothetical protein
MPPWRIHVALGLLRLPNNLGAYLGVVINRKMYFATYFMQLHVSHAIKK